LFPSSFIFFPFILFFSACISSPLCSLSISLHSLFLFHFAKIFSISSCQKSCEESYKLNN
jgi:hypothetical protein